MIFYVYVDWTTEESPRAFYVGKGNESRVKERDRNEYWQRVAAKHGWRREVVFGTREEKVALDLETQLIKEHKTYTYDNPDRWGCNFTRGGDGTSGYKHTEEHRARMRGEGNPFYGKKHSDEMYKKWSEERKGERCWLYGKRGPEHPAYGVKRTQAERENLRRQFSGERNRNAKLTQKAVDEIRSLYATNEYTQKQLAAMFNVCQSTIYKVLHNEIWNNT